MNAPRRPAARHGISVDRIEETAVGVGMTALPALSGLSHRGAAVLRGEHQLTPEEAAYVDQLYEQADRWSIEEAAQRREAGRAKLWARRCSHKYRTASYGDLHHQQDPSGTHLASRTTVPNAVTSWLDGPHQGLLLKGPSRHGKSYAAHAIGHTARARGAHISVWSMPVLNKALRGNLGEKEEAAAWAEVLDAEILILDDVGQESITDWTKEQFHVIAEHRLTSDGGNGPDRRRTIATTNLGYSELVRLYGDPLVERLLEDAVVAVIEGQKLSVFAADPF